ncbi:MAG: hypothetical protein Q4C25_09770, partial [Bacillota bacterium]|nr:hypothetical protein [Bacillota bacterium]
LKKPKRLKKRKPRSPKRKKNRFLQAKACKLVEQNVLIEPKEMGDHLFFGAFPVYPYASRNILYQEVYYGDFEKDIKGLYTGDTFVYSADAAAGSNHKLYRL